MTTIATAPAKFFLLKKVKKRGASPPPQEGAGVAVLPDHDAVAADLGVTILLRQGVAQIPGTVMVGGVVLPGSGGADHVVAGHRSLSELM